MGHPRSFYDAEESFLLNNHPTKGMEGDSLRSPRKDHRHYGVDQLLYYKMGLNMNSVADQQLDRVVILPEDTAIMLTRARVFNCGVNLTTAQGTLYTGPAKAGALGAATQPYTGISGSGKGIDLTWAAAALEIQFITDLYFALTIAQGADATASIMVFGIPLSPAFLTEIDY